MKYSNTRINFYGDPVSWDLTGKIASYALRRDVQVATFVVAATEFCLPGNWLSWSNLYLCASAIGAIPMIKFYEFAKLRQTIYLPLLLKRACIETKPDNKMPSNLDLWGPTIEKVNKGVVWQSSLMSAMLFGSMYKNPEQAMYFAGLYAVYMTKLAQSLHRWHKVRKGNWIITDKGPPPEPAKKPVTRAFRLTPAKLIAR